ncbi:MAG: hypothetical protein AABY77_03445, partial [Nitrospirota bacterium]
MMSVEGKSFYWIGVVGLAVILTVGGCSKKSVVATTSGTETAPPKVVEAKPAAKADTGSSGGFSKSPKEEAIKSPPMMVAKADQAEIDAR